MPPEGISIHTVTADQHGLRLDHYASLICQNRSRSFLSSLIRSGNIRIDDETAKPGQKVFEGQRVSIRIPAPETVDFEPQPMALDILHEDRHLLVLNKPAGLVVHPGPGHSRNTLVNGLLHHCKDLSPIGGALRPGIVHRLDRDTSGTMVVAKSAAAHEHLSAQFKARHVDKTYLALTWGHFPAREGRITLPIGRHPSERKKMSIHSRSGRNAETRWRIRKNYPEGTLLEVDLKTGRTHQIRVHCAAAGHPIMGDPVYGGRRPTGGGRQSADPVVQRLRALSRQMLHAWRLSFRHPDNDRPVAFQSPLPADMVQALRWLARHGTEDPTGVGAI